MSDFKTWWEREGSAMRPSPNEDIEEFAKRMTQIAWNNGEFVEREACAKVCDDIFRHWLQTDPDEKFATPDADDCARAIRARGAVELRGETK